MIIFALVLFGEVFFPTIACHSCLNLPATFILATTYQDVSQSL